MFFTFLRKLDTLLISMKRRNFVTSYVFVLKRNYIKLFLVFVVQLATAQVPVQQFWVENKTHYFIINNNLWSLNGGATISGTQLTITDNGGGEARSAFYKQKMNIGRNFVVNFTYLASGNKSGNGFVFVIQNQTHYLIY